MTNMTLKEEIAQQLCLTGFLNHVTASWHSFNKGMELVSILFSTSTELGCFISVTALARLYGEFHSYIKDCYFYLCANSRKDDLEFWNINELLLEPCCALKFFPDIEVRNKTDSYLN